MCGGGGNEAWREWGGERKGWKNGGGEGGRGRGRVGGRRLAIRSDGAVEADTADQEEKGHNATGSVWEIDVHVRAVTDLAGALEKVDAGCFAQTHVTWKKIRATETCTAAGSLTFHFAIFLIHRANLL